MEKILRGEKQFGNLRWWHPILFGTLYSLCFPPFNYTFHFIFAPFPLLGFVMLIPLLQISRAAGVKKSIGLGYLYGIAASLSQFYWIGNVVAEGVWHLILIGLCLIALYIGLFFAGAALFFRVTSRRYPLLSLLLFPAFWVVLEWSRSIGELAFPWTFLGYSVSQLLPIAQLSAVTGIYGLSFMTALGNTVIWSLFSSQYSTLQKKKLAAVLIICLAAIAVWGMVRIPARSAPHTAEKEKGSHVRVSCIQPDFNQNRWGPGSLDSSIAVLDSLVSQSRKESPALIILPESALFCYTRSTRRIAQRIHAWSRLSNADIVFGTLDFRQSTDSSFYEYRVYNAAFFTPHDADTFSVYYKNVLVPFSEALPFEGIFPIISRVNLGEADFAAGTTSRIFSSDAHPLRFSPFICYEIIFPSFVRNRARDSVNCLVNLTNDGWFGKTTAPFQHAHMARMRAIENGLPLIRSANSGISFYTDVFGRTYGKTELFSRTVQHYDISVDTRATLYRRIGEWPVFLCIALLIGIGTYHGLITVINRRHKSSMLTPVS